MAAALDPQQRQAIVIASKVSSSLSFLGFLGIAYCYCTRRKWFSNAIGRLVLSLAFVDLVDSVAKFIGRWGPDAGVDSALCQAQGTVIVMGNLAAVLIGLLVSVKMLIVCLNGRVAAIKKNDWVYITGCFVVPLPFGVALHIISAENGVRMIGDSEAFCWISKAYEPYRFYFFYLILWGVFLVQIVAYGMTSFHLFRLEREIRSLSEVSPTSEYRVLMIKRMMVYTLAFVIVWIPGTTNRLYQMSTDSVLFPLSLAHAILSPLRGAVDFGVFLFNRTIVSKHRHARRRWSGTPCRPSASSSASDPDRSTRRKAKRRPSASAAESLSAPAARSKVMDVNSARSHRASLLAPPLSSIERDDIDLVGSASSLPTHSSHERDSRPQDPDQTRHNLFDNEITADTGMTDSDSGSESEDEDADAREPKIIAIV
ncbi:hypothetical protein BC831DRAFT_443120 [Entophlyctis helioformis]|nr:hypothetical protein BC831DRAFT_443120 [Entophlyctis helioformis]